MTDTKHLTRSGCARAQSGVATHRLSMKCFEIALYPAKRTRLVFEAALKERLDFEYAVNTSGGKRGRLSGEWNFDVADGRRIAAVGIDPCRCARGAEAMQGRLRDRFALEIFCGPDRRIGPHQHARGVYRCGIDVVGCRRDNDERHVMRVDRRHGIDRRVADIERARDTAATIDGVFDIVVIVTSSPAFVKRPRSFA
jgi:hypothetical protein